MIDLLPRWRSRSRRAVVGGAVEQLLRDAATDDALRSMGSVVAALSGTRTTRGWVVATWDEEVRSAVRAQRWWGAPGTAAPGPPAPDDLPLSCADDQLGYVRLARALSPREAALLAPLVDAIAVAMAQARTSQAVAALRSRAASLHDELADRRTRAAVTMDAARRALEADLHDGVQADLVGLAMHLAVLEASQVPAGSGPGAPARKPARTASALDPERLSARARAVQARLVTTASGLAPDVLVRSGLPEALRSNLPGIAEGVVQLAVAPSMHARRFPAEVEAAAYYACTEAVVNSRKHAPAARVMVHLEPTLQGLEVHVSDTGPGFEGPPAPGAFSAITDRARAVQGGVDVRSSRRDGTYVLIALPC